MVTIETRYRTLLLFRECLLTMELDKSILTQKQIRDNSEDLQSEFLDLKNWEQQMKRKEQEILNERNEQVFLQINVK